MIKEFFANYLPRIKVSALSTKLKLRSAFCGIASGKLLHFRSLLLIVATVFFGSCSAREDRAFLLDFSSEHQVCSVPGLGFFYLPDQKDLIQSVLRSGEVWESETQQLFEKCVQPGDNVVDAGAYIGSHTVKLARLASPGKVHAFEPQEDIVEVLKINLQLNNLNNAQVHPVGLGDFSCQAEMIGAEANRGATRILHCDKGAETGLPIRTLDSYHLKNIKFMKIDVEGYEMPLLRGSLETLALSAPVMLIEVATNLQKEFIPFMNRLGYDLVQFQSQELLALPRNRVLPLECSKSAFSDRRIWEASSEAAGLRKN